MLDSFPSQSPDTGDPGGVTHFSHIGFDLRKVFGSMSLNRIMFHSDHDLTIQNLEKCVKLKNMFEILEKSLYNNKLHAYQAHQILAEDHLDMKPGF